MKYRITKVSDKYYSPQIRILGIWFYLNPGAFNKLSYFNPFNYRTIEEAENSIHERIQTKLNGKTIVKYVDLKDHAIWKLKGKI
jgi:hypothetical protein